MLNIQNVTLNRLKIDTIHFGKFTFFAAIEKSETILILGLPRDLLRGFGVFEK